MGGVNDTTAGVTPGVFVGAEKVRVTTSPTLNPTTRGGGFEARADTRPGQHWADPGVLDSKEGHGEHVAALTAAASGLNVPATHGVQASLDTVPVALLYRPGGQASLGPPAQK